VGAPALGESPESAQPPKPLAGSRPGSPSSLENAERGHPQATFVQTNEGRAFLEAGVLSDSLIAIIVVPWLVIVWTDQMRDTSPF